MLPPFGFSVGDFLIAAKTFNDIYEALKHSGSATTEFYEIEQYLSTIKTVLLHLQDFNHPGNLSQSASELAHTISSEAKEVEKILLAFNNKIKKFSPAFKCTSTNKFHAITSKIKWAIHFSKQEIPRLRSKIAERTTLISLLFQKLQFGTSVVTEPAIKSLQQSNEDQYDRLRTGLDSTCNKILQHQHSYHGEFMQGLSSLRSNTKDVSKILIATHKDSNNRLYKRLARHQSRSFRQHHALKNETRKGAANLQTLLTRVGDRLDAFDEIPRVTNNSTQDIKDKLQAIEIILGQLRLPSTKDLGRENTGRVIVGNEYAGPAGSEVGTQSLFALAKLPMPSSQSPGELHDGLPGLFTRLFRGISRDIGNLALTARNMDCLQARWELLDRKAIYSTARSMDVCPQSVVAILRMLEFVVANAVVSLISYFQLIYPRLHRIMRTVQSLPWSPSLILTDNIRFEDILGRQHSLNFQYFRSWKVLTTMLESQFEGFPGHGKVLREEYQIHDASTYDLILSERNWERWVFPGADLVMSALMNILDPNQELCLNGCGPVSIETTGARSICSKCKVQVIHPPFIPRITELETDTSDTSSIKSSSSKSPVNSPSPSATAKHMPSPTTKDAVRNDEIVKKKSEAGITHTKPTPSFDTASLEKMNDEWMSKASQRQKEEMEYLKMIREEERANSAIFRRVHAARHHLVQLADEMMDSPSLNIIVAPVMDLDLCPDLSSNQIWDPTRQVVGSSHLEDTEIENLYVGDSEAVGGELHLDYTEDLTRRNYFKASSCADRLNCWPYKIVRQSYLECLRLGQTVIAECPGHSGWAQDAMDLWLSDQAGSTEFWLESSIISSE